MRLLSLFVSLFLLSLSLPAQYTCSTATLTGYYGFTFQGTLLIPAAGGTFVPMPTTLMGTVTLPGDGTGTGKWSALMADQFLEGDFVDFTIAVNSDCTGTTKYKLRGKDGVVNPRELIETIVVHQNGNHVRSAALQAAMGISSGSGEWIRISIFTDGSYACSTANLSGRYSLSMTSTAVYSQAGKIVYSAPSSILSAGSFDATGSASGSFLMQMEPSVAMGSIRSGSVVTVNRDCTGLFKFALDLPPGVQNFGEIHHRLLVLGGGSEVRSMFVPGDNPNGANVGIATWERISQTPLQ